MKKLLLILITVSVLLSACGASEDKSTLADVEKYMMSHDLLEGDRIEPMATMIGAVKGFKYVASRVEVYEYDTKSDTYKNIVKTKKVTVGGFDMNMSVSAVNGKYVLFYTGDDDSVVEGFKEFDHRDAPVPEVKSDVSSKDNPVLDPEDAAQQVVERPIASEPITEPTPTTVPTPTPEPTPTSTPKPTKPPRSAPEPVEEDYSDWTLFQTSNFDLVREGMWDGEVIYIEEDYYMVSPRYYDDVLEPYMDALLELQEEFANTMPERENTLRPDAEYEFVDDPGDDYDEDALYERINEMIENELATSGDD